MLINILPSSSHEKKEEFYRKRVFLCGSTRFPASIGELFNGFPNFSDLLDGHALSFLLCLRIADFIHLHGTFLTYLNILINSFLLSLHMNLPNSFVRSMKAKLSHRIQKLLHVRTIKTNPALHASSLLQKKPPFQRSTAPSSKRVPRKHTQYRMKIRKHCPCCTAQNLPVTRISQRTPPPSLRRYRARQKNSLHSDRQLGDTKHALADMDGRLCASQVAEQSMQHPAKGRQKARSL